MLRLVALAVSLSGCSLVGGESEIVVEVVLPPDAQALGVEVSVGGDLVAAPARRAGVYRTGIVSVASKPILVSCSVTSGSVSTMGFVELEVQNGWRYPVTCAVQEDDPADLCFGCRGSQAFVLDPGLGVPSGHRLWVVWAGDSIDSPPVY